jgi:hypothetical protein
MRVVSKHAVAIRREPDGLAPFLWVVARLRGAPSSTIGLERATNPFLRCPDLPAFIALKRDWPTVKLRLGLK